MNTAELKGLFGRVLDRKNGTLIKEHPVILERLFGLYNAWYDVSRGDMGSGLPLLAMCVYRSRSEKFVLSRKAKLWGVEMNEYLYLFSVPELNKQAAEECVSFSIENALSRIKPHSEHMYSFITAVFVADKIDDETLAYIRRHKFNKSYKLGLHGSSPLKTAVFDVGRGKIITNNMGRDLRKQIRNICKERNV